MRHPEVGLRGTNTSPDFSQLSLARRPVTTTSVAKVLTLVAPASRRLSCVVSEAHKPAGETPALQNLRCSPH
jgi:hypothetical protein